MKDKRASGPRRRRNDSIDMHEVVKRSRQACGLPAHIEDPEILDTVAAMIIEALTRKCQSRKHATGGQQ